MINIHIKSTISCITIALYIGISHAQIYQKHIDCGSSVEVDECGILWGIDNPFDVFGAGYVNGEPIAAEWGTHSIGGTGCTEVFQIQRAGFDAYRFNVPPSGYLVRLQFSECQHHAPGRRIFDVIAEDEPIIHDIDLYESVGKEYAVPIAFYVWVNDGTLDIAMPASVGQSLLAAVSVISINIDDIPPSPPGWLNATSGYDCNTIYWQQSPEIDIAGYMVFRRNVGGTWELITADGTPLHRHIDDGVLPGTVYEYAIAAFDVFGNVGEMSVPSSGVSPMVKGETSLPICELLISEDQIDILADDPRSDEYVIGTFVCEGDTWSDIGVRHRGNVSREVSKKSWKVKFDTAHLFEDEEKLNLASEFKDPSMLRNHYASNLYRWVGIDAPYADFANLWLNDKFYGVFLRLEQMDEAYLRHRGYDEDDIIYRCNWMGFYELDDYSSGWEIETGADDFDEIEELIKLIKYTPDSEIETALDSAFDIKNLLRYYAIIILTSNNDFSIHNYNLHLEDDYKWRLLPWDHNVSFWWTDLGRYPLDLGTHYSPQTLGGPNTLLTRLMRVNSFRQRYCDILDSLTSSIFTAASAEAYIDSISSYIRADIYADYGKGTYEDNPAWEASVTYIEDFVGVRVAIVRPAIEDFRQLRNPAGVYINEICASNSHSVADEYWEYDDWLELYNATSHNVNIGGWHLSDDIDSTMMWELPDIDIPPKDFLLIWLDGQPEQGELHAPFSLDADGEFVGLFDHGNPGAPRWWDKIPHAIDLVWFGEQKTDTTWARCPDGGLDWFFDMPTPSITNAIEYNVISKSVPIKIDVYPNPFNSACRIEVDYSGWNCVPVASSGSKFLAEIPFDRYNIRIIDISGKEVDRLGTGLNIWCPPNALDSGIYFALIDYGYEIRSAKIIYLK